MTTSDPTQDPMPDEMRDRFVDDVSVPATLVVDTRRQIIDGASLVIAGTMFWLAPLALLAVLGNAIALWAVDRWGTIEQSIWSGAFIGPQPWVAGAAGVAACYYFVPTLIAVGSTRRVAAWATALCGAFIAVGGALIATVGFAVEARWLRGRGVTAWLNDDRLATAASVGYPLMFVCILLLLLAAFAGGWGIMATLHAVGDTGYWAIPLWFVPSALTTLVVAHHLGNAPFNFADRLHLDNAAVGLPIAVAIVALTWVAAIRLARRARID